MKKFWISILLVVTLFSVSATTIFAQNNNVWFNAMPLENGQVVSEPFLTNPGLKYYSIVPSPEFSRLGVVFLPPDDQNYTLAVYRKSDFENSNYVQSIAHRYVNDGYIVDLHIAPEPGETYIISVSGAHSNTFPTDNFTLIAYGHNFPTTN